MLSTLEKENRGLAASLQEFAALDLPQRELLRESLRISTQLAAQLNDELSQ